MLNKIPFFFVADNELYLLSGTPRDAEFEVYSPDIDSWHLILPQPKTCRDHVNSYIVVGQTLFFGIEEDVLPFHLDEENGELWHMFPLMSVMDMNLNSLPLLWW